MYKANNHISPLPMQELFTKQDIPHNLRNKRCWEVPRTRAVCYGTETIRYRGPQTWELVPVDMKEAESSSEFKLKIKKWKATNCTCRLCKTYVTNLGYINSFLLLLIYESATKYYTLFHLHLGVKSLMLPQVVGIHYEVKERGE